MISNYSDMNKLRKKELKNHVLKMMINEKYELKLVEDNLIAAMRERINLNVLFLSGQIGLEQFVDKKKKLTKYILSWFKVIK